MQAWGESAKQKKKHQEKKQASSAPQEDLPKPLEPEPEERPVLTFPWEEDIFDWDWREIAAESKEEEQEIPAQKPRDTGLSAVPSMAREEEDHIAQDYHRTISAGDIGAKSRLEKVVALKSGFPLEPEDVIRGYIWYEILQPPRAKRPFFPRGIR